MRCLRGIVRSRKKLVRTHNGTYYALAERGGKQIKKSLKTKDRKLAEQKLTDFVAKVDRLGSGSEYRTIGFEELAKKWLASVKPESKPNSYSRRSVAINGLLPHFTGRISF